MVDYDDTSLFLNQIFLLKNKQHTQNWQSNSSPQIELRYIVPLFFSGLFRRGLAQICPHYAGCDRGWNIYLRKLSRSYLRCSFSTQWSVSLLPGKWQSPVYARHDDPTQRVSAAMLNKENYHLNQGFCLPIFPSAAPFTLKPREAGTSGGSPCPCLQLLGELPSSFPAPLHPLPQATSAPEMGERNDDIAGRIWDCLFSLCSHLLPV